MPNNMPGHHGILTPFGGQCIINRYQSYRIRTNFVLRNSSTTGGLQNIENINTIPDQRDRAIAYNANYIVKMKIILFVVAPLQDSKLEQNG
jgi:hypothetical protein